VKPANLAADKAYDTNAIQQHLKSAGVQAVIPPLDEHLYASRKSGRTVLLSHQTISPRGYLL
jgi:hypothetical protein